GLADGVRHVGAVDRVLPAGAEPDDARAHRVARRAAGNDVGQAGIVALDLGRRRPGRIDLQLLDIFDAAPLLAGLADGDGVADRLARRDDVIELPLAGADHDGAGVEAPVVHSDDLTGLCGQCGR